VREIMAFNAAIRRQITVPIANQPGTLAGVTGALKGAGVDIEAFTVFEGQAHLLVDESAGAAIALRAARYACVEQDVLAVVLRHESGSLAEASRILADAGINIDYGYSGPAGSGEAVVVLAVSDLRRALEKLAQR
jgi:hypothetical protein